MAIRQTKPVPETKPVPAVRSSAAAESPPVRDRGESGRAEIGGFLRRPAGSWPAAAQSSVRGPSAGDPPLGSDAPRDRSPTHTLSAAYLSDEDKARGVTKGKWYQVGSAWEGADGRITVRLNPFVDGATLRGATLILFRKEKGSSTP